MTSPLTIMILAAGHGTRMKSHTLKLFHEVAGMRLVDHVRLTAESLSPDQVVFVIAPGMEALEQSVAPHTCVIQSPAKGTGHAVQVGMQAVDNAQGIILVMLGDCPVVTREDAENLIAALSDDTIDAAYLAAKLDNPFGLGRMKIENNILKGIVEETEASATEKEITLVNGGLAAFRADRLPAYLAQLTDKNNKGEIYLTDIPALAAKDGRKAVAVETHPTHILGVNTRADLAAVEKIVQQRLRTKAMSEGVTLRDPETVFLCMDTRFSKDVTIEPNVVIGKGVIVQENVTIKAFCHLEEVELKQDVSVGPFARIRGGSTLEEGVQIGNFVEVKKSHIGKKTKAAHLTYIGDSDIGNGTNIGAGTITCNYDGMTKHKTIIGDDVFIGSNSTLVAPLSIGNGAFVAAGSTITQEVPTDALALGRARQDVKAGWVKKRKEKK